MFHDSGNRPGDIGLSQRAKPPDGRITETSAPGLR